MHILIPSFIFPLLTIILRSCIAQNHSSARFCELNVLEQCEGAKFNQRITQASSFIYVVPIRNESAIIRNYNKRKKKALNDIVRSNNVNKHLALFTSTGCYGHDVLMKEIGIEFDNNPMEKFHIKVKRNSLNNISWNITWVQILMHDFGFPPMSRPSHWQNIVLNRSRDPEEQFIHKGNELLWHMPLPFDHDKPWDLRGLIFFIKILKRNNLLCVKFHKFHQFQNFLQLTKLTAPVHLIVVDHLIQECFTMTAALLNSTTVQFSNWPISDRYVGPLNVPTNPAYVPTTTTLFNGRYAMSFVDRVRNALMHLALQIGRMIQENVVNRIYANINHPEIKMTNVEAAHLFYAGRSEFLFDVIRPISNRIKHFGCAYCKSPSEYFIRRPSKVSCSKNFNHLNAFNNNIVNFVNDSILENEQCQLSKISQEEQRYLDVQAEFKQLDLKLLDRKPFILVSFGSIAKFLVEYMPKTLLNKFLEAFGESKFNVIWQTNSDTEKIFKGDSMPVRENIHFHRWLPIRILLAHRNIHYAILHGGINTINELLMFGVPILGVPLQGDQSSNIKRLTELNMGEFILLRDVWKGELLSKMKKVESNYERYAQRARLIASMANAYRNELRPRDGQSLQHFWLQWAARHGARLRSSSAIFRARYRTYAEYFLFVEWSAFLAILIIWIKCLKIF